MEKTKEITLNQIESSAKIGALIGLAISAIITAMMQMLLETGTIPIELFYALGCIFAFFFGLQGMYYVKFIIEKILLLKEQKQKAEIFLAEEKHKTENQLIKLDREIEKLHLECAIKGVSTTGV